MKDPSTTSNQHVAWERPLISSMLKADPVDLQDFMSGNAVDIPAGENYGPVTIVAVVAVAATVAKSDEVLGRLTLEERGAIAGKIEELRANPELYRSMVAAKTTRMAKVGNLGLESLAGPKALDLLEKRLDNR